MTQNMKGRIAIVTGGTKGIGRAAALTLSRQGAVVVVTGRDTKGGSETARLVKNPAGTGPTCPTMSPAKPIGNA